jgi:hypothetical protein
VEEERRRAIEVRKNCRKNREFCLKMPVYAMHRDPTFGVRFPRTKSPELESLMSRRQLTLVVLTLASLVATACGTSPTAPTRDAPVNSGVSVGSG